MSRFMSEKYASLKAYVPGEQPRDMKYIKLNTNESPFPPSPGVAQAVREEAGRLQLYSDPECTELRAALAPLLGVEPSQLLMTNGSDEALNFAVMAFGDEEHPFLFPDITYGFYPVFCAVNRVPFEEIPLREDMTVGLEAYLADRGHILLANPNAPTGIPLPLERIEQILRANPHHIVVVDEAYVDFGGETAVSLIARYDNLLVVRTFSKSFSMAGARLGFAVGQEALIRDLNTVKYSTNPYNVNRMTMAAGTAACREADYYMANCRVIAENRAYTARRLESMGFEVLPSMTNFVFAKHPKLDGEYLYRRLKEKGVLVRHFSLPRIAAYNRITIGTREQMDVFLRKTEEILNED